MFARFRIASSLGLVLVLCAVFGVAAIPRAEAAFPGSNGRIAFMRQELPPVPGSHAFAVYSMNADGSDDSRLARGIWPRWSADGARVLYSCFPNLCAINADGSGQTNLPAPASGYDTWGAWSPDGGKIVFTHSGEDTAGDDEIFVANSDGTGRNRLTFSPGTDWVPSWSPDGTRIAFTRRTSSSESTWVMNADGSGQTQLTFQTTDLAPEWSPDGTKIAFQRQIGRYEIFVMNADGSSVRRLTDNAVDDQQPAWSPDGKQLVFVSSRDEFNDELYIMNADGSDPTRITTNSVQEAHPHWQPDLISPDTRVVAGPTGFVRSASATFAFESSTEGATFTCSLDGGAYTGCTSPETYGKLTEGTHRFLVRATSPSGFVDPSPASRTWTIDLTPPTISFLQRTQPNAAGWNRETVVVEWSCQDALSGVVGNTVSVEVSSEGRDQTATGTCTDRAGNTASDTQIAINIDHTAPTIAFIGRTPPNGAGWNNGAVAVKWSCTDDLSGAAEDQIVAEVRSEGKDQTATGTCTDLAGNQVSNTQTGINIDLAPPLTTIDAPLVPLIVRPGVIAGSASDNLSGVARTEVDLVDLLGRSRTIVALCVSGCGTTLATWAASLSGVTPGLYQVRARSTDVAGNAGPASLPVTLLIV